MPSNLQLQTPTLDFGSVVTGSTATLQCSLVNTGDEAAIVSAVDADAPYTTDAVVPFTVTGGNGTAVFNIIFTAGTVGATPAQSAVITSDDPGSPLNCPLTSTSVAAAVKALSANPSSYMFAATKIATNSAIQVIVMTNTGDTNTAISAITFPTGFIAGTPIPTLPATVIPGGTLSFGVKFHPVGQGYVSGNVQVASNAVVSPVLVGVSGIGFAITPAYIASGDEVVLAAFGNTVMQFDADDLNCEEDATLTKDWNLASPGIQASFLQLQLNHETKGASSLRLDVDNQLNQTVTADITLSTLNNDKIRAAFGNLDEAISGEVHTVTLTHDADDGQVSITSYIIRYEPRGPVIPVIP